LHIEVKQPVIKNKPDYLKYLNIIEADVDYMIANDKEEKSQFTRLKKRINKELKEMEQLVLNTNKLPEFISPKGNQKQIYSTINKTSMERIKTRTDDYEAHYNSLTAKDRLILEAKV
jgi:hypothetical protein